MIGTGFIVAHADNGTALIRSLGRNLDKGDLDVSSTPSEEEGQSLASERLGPVWQLAHGRNES